ncbi:MAG: Rpn family recombination-promoting nuclease/putative transposase [Fimbriimonadia bacterium]|nr:Rpn family recombination-promoting nuclease/putative transposase [Fimbriimonadia bacterium]
MPMRPPKEQTDKLPASPYRTDETFKTAIQLFFKPMAQLLLPDLARDIDWKQPYTFLDKELQKLHPQNETQKRFVDTLVQVTLKNGNEQWLLIHIEIQAQSEEEFPQRMWEYFYRLMDRYRRPVVSVALLADENRAWRPSTFQYEGWGTRLQFEFRSIKLIDYSENLESLARSKNPFALVILAYLKALRARGDARLLLEEKIALARSLSQRGYNVRAGLQLLALLDRLVALPAELELAYEQYLQEWTEMPETELISNFERRMRERYLQEGIAAGEHRGMEYSTRDSVRDVLRVKFGRVPRPLDAQLRQISEVEALRELLREAVLANTLDEFAQAIEARLSQ